MEPLHPKSGAVANAFGERAMTACRYCGVAIVAPCQSVAAASKCFRNGDRVRAGMVALADLIAMGAITEHPAGTFDLVDRQGHHSEE
jgi:hypothetical protein